MNSEEDAKKELVVVYHDKAIFCINECQSWMWGEEDRPAILPKTKDVKTQTTSLAV